MSEAQSSAQQIAVIIPCFNEAGAIGAVLDDLLRFPYRLIVVDDCSTDRSVQICRERPGVTVLHHYANLGQGASLQTGLTFALRDASIGWLITFDADGQHSSDEIQRLLSPLLHGEADVTLGSRFCEGGTAHDMPLLRRMVVKLATWMTRWSTGLNVTDTHNGLRGLSRAAAEKIKITQNRMAHASEILHQIARLKLRYREVPVTIRYNDYTLAKGQSLMNAVNILWDLFFGGS